MNRLSIILTALLLVIGGFDGFAQVYNGVTQRRCAPNTGDTVVLTLTNVPSPAGNGTIRFKTGGDLDLTTEFFELFSENGGLIGTSPSMSQCDSATISFTVPIDSLLDWGSDGTITFVADASSQVNSGVCSAGNCAQVELDYPFVTVPNDIRVSGLVSPVNFCSGQEDIRVTVSNSGTNQVTSAVVQWTFDGVPQTPFVFSGLLDTVGGSGSTSAQVLLGSKMFAPGIAYNLQVWSTLPNGVADANPKNDTLGIPALKAALAGTFTIGQGGTYPTIQAAADDIAANGVCGPVTFNILSGTYNEQIAIGSIPGASSTNTITFQSQVLDADSVTITFAATSTTSNYVVDFRNARYINFRHLSVRPTGNTFGVAFAYETGCSNIVIEDCDIRGTYGSSTSSNFSLFYANDVTAEELIIRNNYIGGGSYGTYLRGLSAASPIKRVSLENNTIECYYRGAYFFAVQRAEIIANVMYSNTYGSNYDFYQGINCLTCDGGLQFLNNRIDANTGNYGIYVSSSSNPTATPGLIANNFVHVGGTGTAYGIYVASTTSNIRVVHNSVSITSLSTTSGRALYWTSTTSGSEVKNNIFVNTGGGYSSYISSTSLTATDYNDLFSTGSTLAYYGSSGYANLSALQSGAKVELNSISINPGYTNSTDLYITPLLNGFGTSAGILTDIDGDPRDPNFPDMGADEVVPLPVDMSVAGLTAPVSGCDLTTQEQVVVLLQSLGNNVVTPGTVAQIAISLNGAAPVTENFTISKALNFRDTITYRSTNRFNLSSGGSYKFDIKVILPGDGFTDNDILTTTVVNNLAPALPIFDDFENWGPVSTTPSCQSAGATPLNGWSQAENDGGQWNVNFGATPSGGTGPVFDYLPGTISGKYLYVESDAPCNGVGTEIYLLSPCIDLTTMQNPGINFAYHLTGPTIGSLHIDVVRDALVIPSVWSVSGDQGNNWQTAAVRFNSYKGLGTVRIRIRAVIGGPTSDIAIDDLRLGELPSVDLGAPITDCGFVELAATVPGATYQWSTGATTPEIRLVNTGSSPNIGTYYVTVTNNGLYNVDSVRVTLNPGPNVDLGPDYQVACDADSLVLDAGNPGKKHQWENGLFQQVREIRSPGTYWVSVDDLNGCVKSDTVTVDFKETPVAAFNYYNITSISLIDFRATGGAGDTYLWLFGDGNGSTVQNPQHLYAAGGNYTVTLIVSNECGADTLTQSITVWPTGIENKDLFSDLQLFPNPATATAYLQLTIYTAADWHVEVVNLQGQVVYAHTLGYLQGAVTHTIPVNNLATGMYLVRVTSDAGELVRPLAVQ